MVVSQLLSVFFATMSDSNHCPIEGNADLYGLGIRLGIYFQMLTVQSSGLFSYFLRAEDNIAETAVVFVMSVGTVLVRLIVIRRIEAIEVAFMLTLLTALVNSYRQANQLKGLVQMLYGIEMLALIGIYIWFWWVGMDHLGRSCPDDSAFFFAKVSLWGWFRTFNKVLSVFAGIAGAMSAAVYGVGRFFCPIFVACLGLLIVAGSIHISAWLLPSPSRLESVESPCCADGTGGAVFQ